MHLALSPVVLGAGEALFAGINAVELGYNCIERVAGEGATHVVLTRS
jgi:hypothetical protein